MGTVIGVRCLQVLDATILNSANNSVNSSVSWLFFHAIPYSSECASASSTIAHIRVNRLDEIWLSCLDMDEHEFELMDATMIKPHGWILGARLPDHTEDVMTSVVFDADSEFVMLIRVIPAGNNGSYTFRAETWHQGTFTCAE